jgi:hypothetical protein
MVKTSLADRKPYVCETPTGSQMTQRMKSSIMMEIPNLNTPEYIFGGKRFMTTDRMRILSDIAQISVRHFALSFPTPPGKDTSQTAI